MSLRNVAFEKWKEFGITDSDISNIEIREGSKLLIYTHHGSVITTGDPYLVKLAKIAFLNGSYADLPRERLVKRLYATEVVYRNSEECFIEFTKKIEGKTSEELATELDSIERMNRIDENFKDFLMYKVHRSAIERDLPSSFNDLFRSMEGLKIDDLVEKLVDTSSEPKRYSI